MINLLSSLKALGICLAALTLVSGSRAQTVPPLINYQGRLTDQNGNSLSAGIYSIQFRIWDSAASTNGTVDLIWGQQQNTAIQSNGVFNVILGSPGGSPLSGATPAVNNLAYAFTGSNCFLGVTIVVSNGTSVASPSEILPRQQFLSVPFAIQAQSAQSASALVSGLANALCPPGSIMAYMGTNAPPGWLVCDGSAVSRTNYAALFGVLGSASGSGDGLTSFNLPDLRGLFLRGVDGPAGRDPDNSTRSAASSGGNIGNAVGSLEQDMFASHSHSALYTYQYNESSTSFQQITRGWNGASPSTELTTAPAGGSETRPKNAYVNYIIKY